MQKHTINLGCSNKYYVEAAAIFCNENEQTPEIKSERKYEGMLLIRQKGFERARYGASEIRIHSNNKSIVIEQLKQIASLYPPRKDLTIIDMGELS